MNGALTIGTLDGANVEIREEVGQENFFLFGLTADEVIDQKMKGYHPKNYYNSNPHLREVIDQIRSGHFSCGDAELFRPLVENLLNQGLSCSWPIISRMSIARIAWVWRIATRSAGCACQF